MYSTKETADIAKISLSSLQTAIISHPLRWPLPNKTEMAACNKPELPPVNLSPCVSPQTAVTSPIALAAACCKATRAATGRWTSPAVSTTPVMLSHSAGRGELQNHLAREGDRADPCPRPIHNSRDIIHCLQVA